MTDVTIIEKVQKVLALASNNPSEEEGQAAMLMAQKIMIENNLTMSDINTDAKSKEVTNETIFGSQNSKWWHQDLAVIIANNFKCALYIHRRHRDRITEIRFVGLKNDVETAKQVYNYAVKVVSHNCKNYVKKYQRGISIKGVKNQYLLGFLDGLRDKFAEQVKNNSWGLIVVKDPVVDEEFSKLKLRSGGRHTVRINGNEEDRLNGYRDGKNFNMVSGEISDIREEI